MHQLILYGGLGRYVASMACVVARVANVPPLGLRGLHPHERRGSRQNRGPRGRGEVTSA